MRVPTRASGARVPTRVRAAGVTRARAAACAMLASGAPPAIVSGLGELARSYDAVLLDQFGVRACYPRAPGTRARRLFLRFLTTRAGCAFPQVLHDGTRALHGAVRCFEKLAGEGVHLTVLSNTSCRKQAAAGRLPSLGFDPSLLAGGIVCSGELAWEHMRAGVVAAQPDSARITPPCNRPSARGLVSTLTRDDVDARQRSVGSVRSGSVGRKGTADVLTPTTSMISTWASRPPTTPTLCCARGRS